MDNTKFGNRFKVGPATFEAFGDRIIILEDRFKSGYECTTCGGTGKSALNPEMRCKECEGRGALLHIPEVSERRPTTGCIVSIGEDVKKLRVGQSVMYSSFAGHTVDLHRAGEPCVLRILHEPEVLTLVDGHLDLRSHHSVSDQLTFV